MTTPPTSDHPLLSAMDASVDARDETPRGYLGGSEIGGACPRALWYKWREFGADKPSPRLRRIFQQGHDIEDQVVSLLKATPGVTLLERDPNTRRQWEASLFGGHVKSHFDGLIKAPDLLGSASWHVLEIKSMNAARFRKWMASGVARTDPKYWSQMQFYMHSPTGRARGADRSLFVSFNKDTAEIGIEVVDYEFTAAWSLEQLAGQLVTTDTPPERAAQSPTWWECKFCPHVPVCWEDQPVSRASCRQCKHYVADTDAGGWLCTNPDSPNFKHRSANPCDFFSPFDGHR